jgi:predicted nucleic acid-binding Zn ribbon protein
MKSDLRILNGYRVIFLPEHPRAMTTDNWDGYVYEHIVVAEKFLGRPLRDNEIVHHLNENRSDNRSKNLLVIEKSQHVKLHQWLIDKDKPEPEPLYCKVCLRTCESGDKYCSPDCYSIASRRVIRPSKDYLAFLIATKSFVAIGRMYGVSDNAIRKWASH